jgi:hypothetical protein
MLMQSHMPSREQRSKPLGFISLSFKLMSLSAQFSSGGALVPLTTWNFVTVLKS